MTKARFSPSTVKCIKVQKEAEPKTKREEFLQRRTRLTTGESRPFVGTWRNTCGTYGRGETVTETTKATTPHEPFRAHTSDSGDAFAAELFCPWLNDAQDVQSRLKIYQESSGKFFFFKFFLQMWCWRRHYYYTRIRSFSVKIFILPWNPNNRKVLIIWYFQLLFHQQVSEI